MLVEARTDDETERVVEQRDLVLDERAQLVRPLVDVRRRKACVVAADRLGCRLEPFVAPAQAEDEHVVGRVEAAVGAEPTRRPRRPSFAEPTRVVEVLDESGQIVGAIEAVAAAGEVDRPARRRLPRPREPGREVAIAAERIVLLHEVRFEPEVLDLGRIVEPEERALALLQIVRVAGCVLPADRAEEVRDLDLIVLPARKEPDRPGFGTDRRVVELAPERPARRRAREIERIAAGARADVDDAGHGVAAIEARRRTADDLDLLDVDRGDVAQVDDAVDAAEEALAVEEDEHLVRIGALHADRAGAETELLVLVHVDVGDQAQDRVDATGLRRLDLLARDHLRRHRRLVDRVRRLGTGDDGLAHAMARGGRGGWSIVGGACCPAKEGPGEQHGHRHRTAPTTSLRLVCGRGRRPD